MVRPGLAAAYQGSGQLNLLCLAACGWISVVWPDSCSGPVGIGRGEGRCSAAHPDPASLRC